MLLKASAILAAVEIFTTEELLPSYNSKVDNIEKEKEKVKEFFVK